MGVHRNMASGLTDVPGITSRTCKFIDNKANRVLVEQSFTLNKTLRLTVAKTSLMSRLLQYCLSSHLILF